jgi:glycosyltransferase involved in cell wall biosynthesis
VVTIHDLIPLTLPSAMPNAFRRAVYRRILMKSLERAVRVIAPSVRTGSEVARLGVTSGNVDVVPHGVSDAFHPASPDERSGAQARFAGGRKYVAAIASARPHKNLAGLMSAAGEIFRRTSTPLITVGHRIADPPAVRSLGPVGDDVLRDVYAGAELLLLPSYAEGFGLPLLESLACGTPVVCGREVGALEYLRGGALVTDVRDAVNMAEAAVRILEDDVLQMELSSAGRSAAQAMTLEEMGRRTNDVYLRALESAS